MIALHGAGVTTDEGAVVLADVTVEIAARRTAIVGANGSGKTTLARLLNGLTSPTSGTVTVDGIDTVTDTRTVQRQVGFVFQNADHQLVYPTPLEDVALGLRARGVRAAEATERAAAELEAFGLSRVADQAIHTLSGGEKHLVALAAVVVLEPRWIVLDEPTTSLDLVNRRRVIDAIDALEARCVVVSHDLDLVRAFDRAILLDAGRVAADGPPEPVIAKYLDRVAVA